MANYRDLKDEQFIEMIFLRKDRLGMNFVAEAKRRRERIIPLLCDVLTDEDNYKADDERSWSIIHAAQILGILGAAEALDCLLVASGYADKYAFISIWDVFPECYLRLGPAAIPKLKNYVEKYGSLQERSVLSEVDGLWNIWSVHPETREEIEGFFLNLINAFPDRYELNTHLMIDFMKTGRSDLKPVFENFFERGDVDLNVASREDLDYFLDPKDGHPGFRKDLESFYSEEEMTKRQNEWDRNEAGQKFSDIEEEILENFHQIGRNDPCPCESGKKFRACHLKWAQEQLAKERMERAAEDNSTEAGQAIIHERYYEAALRRFLSAKGQTALFSELKAGILEVLKSSDYELSKRGLFSYFDPILEKITFHNEEEMKGFMNDFMEYHNSLAEQFIGHPREKKRLH